MLVLQRGSEAGLAWPLERRHSRSAAVRTATSFLMIARFRGLHARIAWRGDHYEIEDLGSKNGTHLNGRDVIGSQPLHDGDEIQIALRFKLAFVDAGATAPLVFERPAPTGLRLETATHQVLVDGKLLEPPLSRAAISPAGADLINAPGVVSRDDIVRAVWPDAADGGVSEQSIDALVRRLRERLARTRPRTPVPGDDARARVQV